MPNNNYKHPLYAVILAGGVGTRLWPSSRRSHPKQFSDIIGSGTTMIQATVNRIAETIPPRQVYIATGEDYAELCRQQLPDIPENQLILEPSGRNTAPAVGLAAFRIHRHDPSAILALMHSDHVIPNEEMFRCALQCAANAAREGTIVTLGIQPTHAHTGYGYIERGEEISTQADCPLPLYSVVQFLEKPNLKLAEEFVADGAHYWNAGIFIARVDRLLDEYQRQQPQLYGHLQSIDDVLSSELDEVVKMQEFKSIWNQVDSIAFDNGIMEGANNISVVPLDAGWNDIGSWSALNDVLSADESNNLCINGEVISIRSSDNIVSSEKAVIALIDVHDLVVIDTGDAILIGRKDQMQRVREVVNVLSEREMDSVL